MMEDITARLRQLINGSGRSYRQLADEMGISFATIGGWLNLGKLPDAYNTIKVCQYFHVSADWLLGLSEKGGVI